MASLHLRSVASMVSYYLLMMLSSVYAQAILPFTLVVMVTSNFLR